ncbi:acyltransferase family protein [Escherichia coli]
MNTISNDDQQYRRAAIDYAKALGIIVVVIGHYSNNIFNVMTPYMYHMPLFFMIGGIVFNENKNPLQFLSIIIRKFFFYIVIVDMFLLLVSYLIQESTGISGLYKAQSSIYDYAIYFLNTNMHISFLFLVSWFLFAYAMASILLYCYLRITKHLNRTAKSILSVLTIIACGWVSIDYLAVAYKSEWNILNNYGSQILFALAFMLIGKTFKDLIFKSPSLLWMCLAFLLVITMRRLGLNGDIGVSWSNYKHGFLLTYVQILLCSYIVFSLSCMLSKAIKSKTILYIGRESKCIMSFHLLAFILLDIIFGWMGMYEIGKAKALTHFSDPLYWPVYIVAGIVIPIIINLAILALRKYLVDMAGNLIKTRKPAI